jgi:ubiquinone/menaquinone biosynthesis C-methylase UbiE
VSYYSAVIPRPAAIPLSASFDNGALDPVTPGLDALSLQFVIWAQETRSMSLDIGCGDGIATLALLARGGHVTAVDPDAAVLHRLVERVPSEQCRRLKVRLGQIPEIDFKQANFAAIHAARVLHLLELEEVRRSLRKLFRWLYPRGKLFVSTLTPSGAQELTQSLAGSLMGSVSPMDEATLTQEIVAAGMLIEQSFTYVPPWRGAPECCAVIARCGS